ncbi:anaerobic ribonucleoside-triphosphate reductase activating protein [Castellaniella sp.]|uniref:anaerobic ribonucleoside-triphosphate reductase activating protein n=1 Tax=Castellaniella sp. TaxID=1955812 RepID=UPI002AFEC46A|nr:anaerobic ribonucleoside-triphosphate reductase activating protein [Castellaniella sp.]
MPATDLTPADANSLPEAIRAATQPRRPTVTGDQQRLKVGGLVPFTATDYPGLLAAVIFVQGCPWRCGYCHNPHLQPRTADSPVPWDDIIAFLRRRTGLIDGVVFSGGEPTMDPGLASAMQQVQELGYKIGLHTGGTHPRRLAQVLPLVDWVGLDIKTRFDHYAYVTGVADSGIPARASLQAVLDSGVDFECRTTAHPSLIDAPGLLALGQTLASLNVRRYAVQIFRPQGCVDTDLNTQGQSLRDWPGPTVETALSGLFSNFEIRRP